MFRVNNFDKLLDKATSNLRLEPDWPTILQICDLIRQNDCSPKYAVAAVKKKLYSQNPHQAMFALLTLESIVKNCGSGVHDEVASKAFCEMLKDLVKTTQHENLRSKILELIQAWAFAFRNSPKYRAVQDTVTILKAESFKFPPLKESDAMFSADTAPEWADGEVCHRCRVAFSLMVRRHHCRACGQVFCQQCSSKTSTLPKFGIEKEVRVCDACYDKVSRPPSSTAKPKSSTLGSEISTTPNQTHEKTKEELQEEEELQLALALSQSEAEQKEKERRSRTLVAPDTSLHPTVSPSASSVSASPEHSTAASTELSRYLDRSYWEQRLSRDSAPAPTAPASAPASNPAHDATEPEFPKVTTNKAQEDDAEDKEIDEFIESLKSQVEIFVNRMKSNSSRGRSIANDTSVQTLFMNITAMHSRLLRYIQQQDDKRVYLESLQDKVSQVRDSRAALDTLRAEHAARLAAAAEAAERQRQMQMAAKLQAMRKKKHEYLQYQRQLALQRVQEQEREMQMRQEQQKHQYMMSANNYYMPGVAMHHFQPGFPNQPMYASAQFHPQMMPQTTTDGSVSLPGQPQMSQANMPMGVNQMGAASQSMPQMVTTYPMSTTGMTLSQAPPGVPTAINQSNRPGLGQQMPLQQQMMMQHMHQMRMPVQPGVHQMMTQNVANGLTGPNLQNTQLSQQMPKHNVPPNQPQQPNTIMPPMSSGQQNIGQTLNPANSMMGMQMQNIRMPLMQGNPPGAPQVSGYPLSMQNQQAGTQMPNISQPSQIPMTGQSMALPGQQMIQGQTLPGHNQSNPINNHIPNQNQNVLSQGPQVSQGATQMPQSQQSQFSQGHHISIQGQPGQQMMMQGHQMIPQGQNIPQQNQQMPQNQMPQGPQMMQGQQINQQMMQGQQLPGPGQQIHPQGQHMPPQGQAPQQHQQMLPSGQQMPQPGQQMPQPGQQMPPPGQQMPPSGQQMPPTGQQMPPSGQQMPPTGQQMPPTGQQVPPAAQQMPTQGQQMPQGQQVTQNLGQPLKMQQQNYVNGQQGQQTNQNQPSQTPTKSEHNNNTAELISFD